MALVNELAKEGHVLSVVEGGANVEGGGGGTHVHPR